MTNRILEIHDSTLESLVFEASDVVLDFSHGYIHQSEGELWESPTSGWSWRVIIRVRQAAIDGTIPELPSDLDGGSLTVPSRYFDTCIPVPSGFDGPIEFVLSTMLGETVNIRGSHVTFELSGEPQFIEEVRLDT